jgi:esterase/lipase superfamily enzyme
MRDVLNTAEALEATYNVIVVPFSWPANGGGVVSGTTAYLDDKRDARVSMDALNRFIYLVRSYYETLTDANNRALWQQAVAQDDERGNWVATQARYTRLLAGACEITVNLLCHSMANYLLKYALKPGDSDAAKLTFDNVALVAADANNAGHEAWVGRIQVRNRLCIVINEDDFALEWSRRKPGDEQLARLGQYLRNLTAANAYYVDVTEAPGVGNAHGYFLGEPVERNANLKALFTAAFEGGKPEEGLRYAAGLNAYQLV